MRNPVTVMADNVLWTRHGTAWALWQLQGVPYGQVTEDAKRYARDLHVGLLRGLRGEALLLSVLVAVDPVSAVRRMIAGLDLDEHQDWALECEATLHSLDELVVGERTFWLAVPLSNGGTVGNVRASGASALGAVLQGLSLPVPVPSPRERAARVAQARDVQETIPGPFLPAAATPASVGWLFSQASGLDSLIDYREDPAAAVDVIDGLAGHGSDAAPSVVSGTAIEEPTLDEGGQTDVSRLSTAAALLHRRRFVKVITDVPGTPGTEYQAVLALRSLPSEGMVFPGTEFLAHLDRSGVPTDWAVRLDVRTSESVARKNRSAVNNLNDQYSQRDGEVSLGLRDLDISAAALQEYMSELAADELEVEIRATVLFRVRADSPEGVNDLAKHLARYLSRGRFRVDQPMGVQQDLWWSMLPGVPAARCLREYEQITTSRSFAAAIPLAGSALGDRKGTLLGLNKSAGSQVTATGLVMLDLAGSVIADTAGSIGIVGEQGSGKSMTLKKLAGDLVDQGGLIVAVDRSSMGEWALWAQSVTDAHVLDIMQPDRSLDPLRIFGAEEGSRVLQSFLTPLLNLAPTSERGVLLSEVLDVDYLRTHELVSAQGLVTHLQDDCQLDGAAALAKAMRVFSRGDLGRSIFDDRLAPLDWNAPALIFRTHTLDLPTPHELMNEHLFAQMSLEKLFGRAMHALIAAISRRICFEDRSRLAGLVTDETHHLTSSPESERELIEWVRVGRKHAALLMFGSHDPEDLGSEILRGLIPNRLLMRQRDHVLARRGLTWLGLNPDDADLVDLVRTDLSPLGPDDKVADHRRGEGLFRDNRTRIGKIKVLAPARADRYLAALTTPGGTSPTTTADATSTDPTSTEPALEANPQRRVEVRRDHVELEAGLVSAGQPGSASAQIRSTS